MDVLNEAEIARLIVAPALDKIRTETIPALQAAVREELNNAVVQLSNVLNGALLAVQGTEDKAAHDVAALVAGLAGWTLDISIPPIMIRLSAPKEKS